MTPLDLIKLALKQAGVVGVGQTPMAEDANDAFALMNMMLAQWNRKRWLIYHLIEKVKIATGALSYTVGPAGDFDIPRAVSIEAAFVRLTTQTAPNQVDIPLRVLTAYEDYASITLKGQQGFPQYVFLDTGNPWGILYVWPVPNALYELHIVFRDTLGGFTSLSQQITLPAEYQEAILYNLAGRLRSQYALMPDPTITALARASLNTVRVANTDIPLLSMPDELVRGGVYNVYSDTSS